MQDVRITGLRDPPNRKQNLKPIHPEILENNDEVLPRCGWCLSKSHTTCSETKSSGRNLKRGCLYLACLGRGSPEKVQHLKALITAGYAAKAEPRLCLSSPPFSFFVSLKQSVEPFNMETPDPHLEICGISDRSRAEHWDPAHRSVEARIMQRTAEGYTVYG